jgi:hypothetical protein
MKRFLTLFATVTLAAGGALLAQNPQYQQNPQYPQNPQNPQDQQYSQDQGPVAGEPDGQYEQGRAVARISVINGDVSVRRGDAGEVVAAAMNAPLMAGDSLLTSSTARAEVQLDYGKVLRIGPNSEVRFVGMDVKSFQMQIAAGTVTFRILRQSDSQAELDTPSIALHPVSEGVYRVSVREDGTSEITVRSGAAEVYSQKGSEQLGPGRTMYARGLAADPEFQVVAAIGMDSWDRWNDDRDRYLQRSQSYEHVSRDISGAEDLDQYGQWTNDPNYGQVWQPTVDQGWAPYRDGRWTWEDYYGWTWVSADPWGWAPYHYGRWFYGGRGWCWYPGSIYSHYNWAPAYVGFFGFGGGHFGVGFGFGGLGWVPLAPFERFHPWYGRGFYGGFRNGSFGNRAFSVNNGNITNMYRNARVNGGVHGVNAGDFGRRSGSFQTVNHAQMQSAGMVRGAVPVAPDRSSLRMSDRNVSGNFARSNAQSFASHNSVSNVNRVPFEQQQRGMQQVSRGNFGSGVGNSGAGSLRSNDRPASTTGGGDRGNFTQNNSVRGGNPAGQSGGTGQANHDWGRFGQPIHGSGAASSGGSSNSGWQRMDNSRQSNLSSEGRGYSNGGGSQPVRISPQIVQQRNYGSNPSYQSPRNYSSPSPSYQAPRSSGPSPSYQAPRSNGGGGGGRPSGGGGGGGRPSGGGGGSHSSGGGGSHGGGGHR